jgi:hypothetical protein
MGLSKKSDFIERIVRVSFLLEEYGFSLKFERIIKIHCVAISEYV